MREERPESLLVENEIDIDEDNLGLPLLSSEIDLVISRLKSGIPTGVDDSTIHQNAGR